MSAASDTRHAVSTYDARPFFEKALLHGVQHGILGPDKLESIRQEAPKGMVQIARYFGSEYLRPELELARDRIVNLVSLHLEQASAGDLHTAAELLRDHSFLSRSKAGSDMLKALIAMPQTTHFGMNERGGFRDEHIGVLAKWSLRNLAQYQAELAIRSRAQAVVEAAIWFAEKLGSDVDALEDAGKDAEAVVRTALLALACKRNSLPDWVDFEKMVLALRKRHQKKPGKLPLQIPQELPATCLPAVTLLRDSVQADADKWLVTDTPARQQFDQAPAFLGRYFWLEDSLAEIEQWERKRSQAWERATGGSEDEGSLLTLFLCLAVGVAPKTVLTEKAAASLVRKIRAAGLPTQLVLDFIAEHAPADRARDYAQLWNNFVEDASATLRSDHDYTFNDALALIRRECNVKN